MSATKATIAQDDESPSDQASSVVSRRRPASWFYRIMGGKNPTGPQNPGASPPYGRADDTSHIFVRWMVGAFVGSVVAGWIVADASNFKTARTNDDIEHIGAETELVKAQTALLAEKRKTAQIPIPPDFYTGPALQLGIVTSVEFVKNGLQVMYRDTDKNCKLITIPVTSTPPRLGSLLGETPDGQVKIIGQEPIAQCNREISSPPSSLRRH